jgi:hypothetical protein
MAIATTTLATMAAVTAATSAAVGAYSAHQGVEARRDANRAYAQSAAEERKVRGEQKALNLQAQAEERRKLVREERVRRARLIQSSENSGGSGSSSEYGALGGMSTQLNSNLGINLGRAAAGERISTYTQNAADFNFAAQQSVMQAQNADGMLNLSMNIFNSAGGLNAFGTPKG